MASGEELYARYRAGDQGAFDGIIELYRENLIFFLLRYLPRMEDAEDAAEDAFVALLLHPWREGKGASLKTYLFRIGRNKALNILKKQKRLAPLEEGSAAPEEVRSLEDDLCRNESRRALLRALEELPEETRETLYLLYFEGLSLDEAARVMGKKKKQLENLAYRGKKALAAKLNREEME